MGGIYMGGRFIRRGFVKRLYRTCSVIGWRQGIIEFICGHLGIYLKKTKLCAIKHRILENYLRQNYTLDIKEVNDIINSIVIKKSLEPKERIWFFWYQDEETMPEVVRLCFRYLKAYNTLENREVVFLSKNNLNEYLILPSYIETALQEERITIAHFSDIYRMALLYFYGGMWLDSTIFVPNTIQDKLFKIKYWSYKCYEYDKYNWFNVGNGRWSLSIRNADQPGEELFKLVLSRMLAYWKKEKYLLDYMWMDLFLDIVYNDYPTVRKDMDAIDINNPFTNKFSDLACLPYDENTYHDILKSTNFFKLTHKYIYPKEVDGRETLYGFIIRNMPK